MVEKIRGYVRARLRDPSAWLSVAVLSVFALWAAWGFSPVAMWNAIQSISLVMAVLEWLQLIVSWVRERAVKDGVLEELQPPSDRWKAAWMVPMTAVVFAAELWVDRGLLHQTSVVGFGLTTLGLSTMVSLWYAWSRPVRLTSAGVLVGVELVPWGHITRVTWGGEGHEATLRIDFGGAGHFSYGSKLRVMVTAQQRERLSRLLPPHLGGALPS